MKSNNKDENSSIHINNNIKAHKNISKTYNETYSEIFNEIEQERLEDSLRKAVKQISTESEKITVMDYGCGTGNLTNHLLNLELNVISADVSKALLKTVEKQFSNHNKFKTFQLNGKDLSEIKDEFVDMVAVYSVLHHIPDYLYAIKEMIRVIKPGGVLYIDHEAPDEFWEKNDIYEKFKREMNEVLPKSKKSFKRFLNPNYYINRYKRKKNPRFQSAGDIHVWPDDHIEWDKIKELIKENGMEIITETSYLGYKREYCEEIFNKYKNKTADVKMLVAKKL